MQYCQPWLDSNLFVTLPALDASGAPNSSVPAVCRELLKDLEAVPWDVLVDEAVHARAARRAGGDDADTPGAPR